MTSAEIETALQKIEREEDPTLKNLLLASITSNVFAKAGTELVIVGGSAIEFYTEGAYTSGDVDFCVLSTRERLTARWRQEVMAGLRAQGGPRSWQVAGGFVDILGDFENLAKTPLRKINAIYGPVALSPAEELLVERVLVSVYPEPYLPARACAEKLIVASLRREVEMDWDEVKRLSQRREYANFEAVRRIVNETAEALKERSPYDSNE